MDKALFWNSYRRHCQRTRYDARTTTDSYLIRVDKAIDGLQDESFLCYQVLSRLHWVMKWEDDRNCIAGAIVTFVDNVRGSGKDSEHAWEVQRFAKRKKYLGIQHAPRKIRPPA